MPGCHNKFGLGIAHVFVSRAKGGLGIKENGVILCQNHHNALDQYHLDQHEKVRFHVENYLRFHYGNIQPSDVIYNRWERYAIK